MAAKHVAENNCAVMT